MGEKEEVEYHSRDFEWEDLREVVERDPSLRFHLTPLSSTPYFPSAAADDADAWRTFHRRHSTARFFKERRYVLKEFPELVQCNNKPAKVLEVGCGNGSTVLPILRENQRAVVYACDCSADVLEKAKEVLANVDEASLDSRFHPFLHDFSLNGFPDWLMCTSCQTTSLTNPLHLPSDSVNLTRLNESSPLRGALCCIGGVDFVTLIFTLSAIPYQKMSTVIAKCISVLKPGGTLFFRDYGLYDMTMLRFPPNQRVGFREYIRLDGTLSYFFSLDIVRDIFLGAGFIELELEYCCVRLMNRRVKKEMQRVWVHGKFQKPVQGFI